MSPLAFAMIITGIVFTSATLALWLALRWYTRRAAELKRQAYVYGVERWPGETDRQLRRRVIVRASIMFSPPPRRARIPNNWRDPK